MVHVKGILRCALVTETSETFQTAEIDQLGLLANLQALISLSTDISESVLSSFFLSACPHPPLPPVCFVLVLCS